MRVELFKLLPVALMLGFLVVFQVGKEPVIARESAIALHDPSAGRIAYVSDRSGQKDLYVMNADGTNDHRLTTLGNVYQPAWSPDVARIAFDTYSSYLATDGEIYVVNADGGGLTRLTNNSAFDWHPSWSPDGSRIAFASYRDGNGYANGEIYVMNADGSGQTRLTTNSLRDDEPAWSAGNRIAFFRVNSSSNWDIYTMNPDGSGQTQLTNNVGANIHQAWSPDGQRIAFVSYRTGSIQIYVMQADGSGVTPLTSALSPCWHPTWSPDGQHIAFTTQGEIYTMNSDGSNWVNLTNSAADDGDPDWGWSEPKAWTLMYYLAGDNNLSGDYQTVLNALTRYAGNDDFYIAVMYDGNVQGDSRYYYSADNVHWVSKDELNTGDPDTLVDFVNWAYDYWPSEHTALIIADHGHGQDGVSFHDSAEDELTMPDLKTAFSQIIPQHGKFDVLFMDACLMASVEAAYQARDATDYYVAYENTGWSPWQHGYLGSITSQTDAEALAKEIAQSFASMCQNNDPPAPYTVSVARMSRLPNLATKLNVLCSLLRSGMSGIADTLIGAQVLLSVQRFDEDGTREIDLWDAVIDLYDFARLLKEKASEQDIKDAAQEVMDAIHDDGDATNRYIVYNDYESGTITLNEKEYDYDNLNQCHGVSVFFPETERTIWYIADWLDFAAGTDWGSSSSTLLVTSEDDVIQWGPMVVEYINETNPDAPEDSEPPDLVAPGSLPFNWVYLPIVLKGY